MPQRDDERAFRLERLAPATVGTTHSSPFRSYLEGPFIPVSAREINPDRRGRIRLRTKPFGLSPRGPSGIHVETTAASCASLAAGSPANPLIGRFNSAVRAEFSAVHPGSGIGRQDLEFSVFPEGCVVPFLGCPGDFPLRAGEIGPAAGQQVPVGAGGNFPTWAAKSPPNAVRLFRINCGTAEFYAPCRR